MANSNNKTNNWLSRLRQLSIRRRSSDNIQNSIADGHVAYRRGTTSYSADNMAQHPHSNSVRRSIIKMHKRVKNAFKNKGSSSNTNRNSVLAPTNSNSSNSNSRVTLSSTVLPKENIYFLEPVRRNSTVPQYEDSSLCFPVQALIEENQSMTAPVIPPRRRNFPQLLSEVQNGRVPKYEIANLSNFYWYWGPISRSQAEERLKESPDGAFLVRDSTSDRYLFTMSFRNIGKILHSRIDYSNSGYSLFDQIGYNSIVELVEDAVLKSKHGVYCYTKTKDEIHPNFPVRLTLPVSRYDKVPSLKYLSRFVIRQYVIINDMDKLPLPVSLVKYLQEDGPYF